MAAAASSLLLQLNRAQLPEREALALEHIRRVDEEAQARDVSLGPLDRLRLHGVLTSSARFSGEECSCE